MGCHDIFSHLLEILESRKTEIYHFKKYPSVLSRTLLHFFFPFSKQVYLPGRAVAAFRRPHQHATAVGLKVE